MGPTSRARRHAVGAFETAPDRERSAARTPAVHPIPEVRPLTEAPPTLPFIGGFESTYLPAFDVDVLEISDHVTRRDEDLALLRACGVDRVRYPLRWHRIQPAPGVWDWTDADASMAALRDGEWTVIADLVHHTSYPRWLAGGFADPRFPAAYVEYCERVALRYPWLPAYTLFNEPFATLFLCGHEGVWPPYHRGVDEFARMLENVLPALGTAARRVRDLLPHARHVWVDSCESHTGLDPVGAEYATTADDRRFIVLEAMLGRADPGAPFASRLRAAGGGALLELEPIRIDVLGLDYYAHHEWAYHATGTENPAPVARGLRQLLHEYHARVGLPMIIGETNLLGAPFDRATWLRHTLEQAEEARADGLPVEGYCWFGFLDSLDWNSLLARHEGWIDPVGVVWLDEHLDRRLSTMSSAYARAAQGAPASALPAYTPSAEFRARAAGVLRLMEHFDWIDPPDEEVHMHQNGIVRARRYQEAA